MRSSAGSGLSKKPLLSALPEAERKMLELMSLVAEPLPRPSWARWMAAVGIRDGKNNAYQAAGLVAPFANLMRLGLVCELNSPLRSQPEYAVEHKRLHDVLEQARLRGDLDALYQRVARYQASLDDADHNPARQIARDALALMHGCKIDRHALEARAGKAFLRRDIGLSLIAVLGPAAPVDRLKTLPDEVSAPYLRTLAGLALEEWVPAGAQLAAWAMRQDAVDLEVRAMLALTQVLRGDASRVLETLSAHTEQGFVAVRAIAHLSQGRLDEARREARQAVERTQFKAPHKLRGVKGIPGLFIWLLLTTDRNCERDLVFAQIEVSTAAEDPVTKAGAEALQAFERYRQTEEWPHTQDGERGCQARPQTWVEALFWGFTARAAGAKWESAGAHRYEELTLGTSAASPWLAKELRALIDRSAEASAILPALYKPEASWERALSQIEAAMIQQTASVVEPALPKERLAWCIIVKEKGFATLSARVQTRTAKGFSAGKRVSWFSLPELSHRAGLISVADRPVISALGSTQGFLWRGQRFASEAGALLELVGHPVVFGDEDAREPVEVVLGAPRFHVRADGELLRITVEPRGCAEGRVHAEHEGHRIVLTALDARQHAIASTIARGDLVVPVTARDRVERIVAGALGHFDVSSDVAASAANVETIAADSRIHIALYRRPRGLRIRVRVRPLASGALFRPGEGAHHVLGVIVDGQGTRHVQTERDLTLERAEREEVFALVPILADAPVIDDEVDLEDPLLCLELVDQLRALGERCVVAWPEGQPLRVVAERSARDLSLKLTNADYWLSASGELTIDDNLKIGLRELLALYEKAEGRFIPLDAERYLALDESLRRELEGLSQFTHEKGKNLLLHPLALPGLSAWAIDVKTFNMDKGVEQRLARVKEAEQLAPTPPEQLQAELRPYQIEGYTWMSRLAHWGAGMCLADDMGLGKTLQTLALLLEHASQGPSLVVAPMSVCRNWLDEAKKFAPSLRAVQLTGDGRATVLASLGPYDLLVCSYGIMQQEIERLQTLPFRVVVLDEAQAIKNASTRRARAAMQLQGSVRIALTGTPVENHLGEIWSIMTFLNPGLLGGVKDFEHRFARPIQREGDLRQAERLKQIIRPFVLRRKKSQVLEELPPKTVITLEVEPSEQEAALFAALREQAKQRLADPSKAHELRFRLLAEITRMRRAACHPSLVAPEANLESSKLNTFEALLSELREGGHRALVFSQFVDYLTMVRKRLETLDIPYQYLDGSSTAKKREEAVTKFQAGEGDVFLISLKAGGFGLNLTAADYVIHLDPWWNPAVEDQASDRAHRIGQTRPVTVYRLVMRTTIEQRILSLHENKREIADQLLEGAEQGSKLSVEDLVALLRED